MAANVDVSGRLDEGQAAVDTIAEYVWACHVLGFLHPDLTGYRYQVQDWYAADDGLDLRVLETECTALAITADAAEQALQLQGNNFRELSQAWQGAGAQASTDFLTRHATSSAQVVAGIGSAAGTLTRLRERLWSAVDAKVATAVRIEARRAGQRGTWLAAARTVSTGVGDLSAASELIDTQVKPFVANDIGGDFLTAMRGAAHAVADAYAEAISALRAETLPTFGVPGELGPAWAGPVAPPGVGALAAVSTPGLSAGSSSTPPWAAAPPVVPAVMPAAMPAGSPGAASPPWSAPGPEPIATTAGPYEAGPYEAGAAAPTSPAGLGSGLGGGVPGVGGLSDIGSGLAGTGRQLADLFGGLLGSSAGGLGDDLGDLRADGIEDLGPDADLDTGEDVSDDDSDGETEDDSGEHVDQNGSEDGENVEETADIDPAGADDGMETADAQEIPAEPYAQESTPVGPPPPVPVNEPTAEPLAAPDGGTPCAIAADELPQAGP